MRGTLGLTHTNSYIQPSGMAAALKARGRLIDLELDRALSLNSISLKPVAQYYNLGLGQVTGQ